ncbi:MAG TPA: non-homologous end-joining DNA ligase [Jatrophihabitantaceae bacterium]|jgi:DNA ligase D-like protein (predicted ligase)
MAVGKGAAVQVSPGDGGLPAWLEPELATLTKDRFSDLGWIFERKLDGERCLAFADGSAVRLMTRNQHEITSTFPEIADALAAQGREPCIVDGEIVAFDGSQTRFERLQKRLGQARPSEALLAAVPAYFHLFDVLYAGNRDTRVLPLLERKRVLRGLLSFDGPLHYTEHRDTEGEAYYREACRLGWEGLIAKRADSQYRAGRTKDWLKFKCITGQEFVIGGFTDPQRSRIGFGAVLLGYYDRSGRLVYAGKVGTGFDNQTLRSLHDRLAAIERTTPAFSVGKLPRSRVHWVEPRLVGQVAFTEWTDAGELRHPRFQGLRDDKDPGEVVREIPAGGEDRPCQ